MLKTIRSFIDKDDPIVPPPPCGRLFFGGSFNPVHSGHLAMMQHVLETEIAQSVLVMPAGQSPFKQSSDYAPAEHRLVMLRSAISTLDETCQSRIVVSDLEIKRPGPSYTADTLQSIRDGVHTALLLGADSLESFHLWKRADSIVSNHHLYVAYRHGVEEDQVMSWRRRLLGFLPMATIYLLPFKPPSCSSTELRRRLGEGATFEALKDCLPQPVYSLIQLHRLYRDTVSEPGREQFP